MMEQHLGSPEEWALWLDLLAAQPERTAALDARASLLYEQRGSRRATLVACMREAAEIERALDQPIPLPLRPSLSRAALVALAALVLGFQGGRWWQSMHAEEAAGGDVATMRGALSGTGGTLRVEQAGKTLAYVVVGRGVRPTLATSDGPLLLRWSGEPGRTAVAWFTRGEARVGGVRTLGPVTELVRPPDADGLIVAVLPIEEAAEAIAERVGDGRHEVEPLGSVSVVAFDLATPSP